jgi:hypothetical protein
MDANRVLLGKTRGLRPNEYIEIGGDMSKCILREIVWCGVHWVYLTQDKDQWRTLEKKTLMNRFYKILRNSWIAERLADSQEGLISMEVFNHEIIQRL